MPVRPENRHLYPPDWKEIRETILRRASYRCECWGECGGGHDGNWCQAPHRKLIRRLTAEPWRWRLARGRQGALWGPVRRVILTIAHLNHDPTDNRPENLRALCQRCHNLYDQDHRIESRRRRKAAEAAVTEAD